MGGMLFPSASPLAPPLLPASPARPLSYRPLRGQGGATKRNATFSPTVIYFPAVGVIVFLADASPSFRRGK